MSTPLVLVTCRQMQVELPLHRERIEKLGYEVLAPDLGVRARLARAGSRIARLSSGRSRHPALDTDANASAETVVGSVYGDRLDPSAKQGGRRRVGAFSDTLRQASVLGHSAVGGVFSLAPSATSAVVFVIDVWVIGALVVAAVIDARRVDVLLGSAGFNYAG